MERRRWPRREVTWSVRLLLGEGAAIAAKAVDVSLHGLRVAVDTYLERPVIHHGDKCRVEVRLADDQARFCREAEIRHIDERGIGLVIADAVPRVLVHSRSEGPLIRPAAHPATPSHGRGTVLRALRSVASALTHR